mgnify:CR=1 FL=1
MFSGGPFPQKPTSLNAYLGAFPIAAALDAGADVVLTGRVVDKRVEDGKNVIELEVVTLAEGQPSTRANVQVELPSKG